MEAKYRALVEQIPAVVFMAYLDKGIGEAYVSPQIETALGFSQSEWLEDPVPWYQQIHPEMRWSEEAAEMFLSGKPLRSADRVIARDGRVLWFQCEAKIEVRKNVLKQNDVLARALRERFREARLLVVSLVSSPGSGKTAFLEKTLTLLHSRYRVAALVGDLATENDAARLARSQAPVKQITTGTVCHLEAAMIQTALNGWDLHKLDFLFIENVGNLVCPSSYDLGEDLRFVLLSVTEGEDKPLKYPPIFNSADVAIIAKWDLAAAVEFDEAAA
jgi:hydrogenase nickel incorporation protein HypB